MRASGNNYSFAYLSSIYMLLSIFCMRSIRSHLHPAPCKGPKPYALNNLGDPPTVLGAFRQKSKGFCSCSWALMELLGPSNCEPGLGVPSGSPGVEVLQYQEPLSGTLNRVLPLVVDLGFSLWFMVQVPIRVSPSWHEAARSY